MNSVALHVTEQCSKKCEYCEFPTLDNPKHFDEMYRYELKRILSFLSQLNIRVYLMGGEIGTIPVYKLDELFDILKSINIEIWIPTNGLFIMDKHIDRYRDYISGILYHMTNSDAPILKDDIYLQHAYVVTNNNIDDFGLAYRRVIEEKEKFHLELYSNRRNISDDLFILNKNNLAKILDIVRGDKTISTKVSNYYTYYNTDLFRRNMDICRYNICCDPVIDLVNNKILPCCRTYMIDKDQCPELTLENFISSFLNPMGVFGKKILDTLPCYSCTKYTYIHNIFQDPQVKDRIRNKILARKFRVCANGGGNYVAVARK